MKIKINNAMNIYIKHNLLYEILKVKFSWVKYIRRSSTLDEEHS